MFDVSNHLFTPARLSRTLAAVCIALSPLAAMALEVGTLHWKPASGQAPFAEIDLSDKEPIEARTLRVNIANREAYDVAGLVYHPGLASALITAQSSGGRVVLRLERLPPNVPALDLLVVVNHRDKLTLAEYRIDLQSGPHDVASSPVGTRKATLARPAVGTKPAPVLPSPAPTPAPTEDAMTTAGNAVMTWAQAWSRRDVDAYLAAYTPDYAGPKSKGTRQAWLDERRERIASRKEIAVDVSNLKLKREGDSVTATFVQSYRSDGPTDRMRKRLVLVQMNGRWLIQREIPLK
jgi:ketosteroid isomerase-like protein